jgi:hypothetical protein
MCAVSYFKEQLTQKSDNLQEKKKFLFVFYLQLRLLIIGFSISLVKLMEITDNIQGRINHKAD